MNKILHDNPTKRVAYRINWHFYFDKDVKVNSGGGCVMYMFTSGKNLYFGIWRFQI